MISQINEQYIVTNVRRLTHIGRVFSTYFERSKEVFYSQAPAINEIESRRVLKKQYITYLVILKKYARALCALQQCLYESIDCSELKLDIGEMTMDALYEMEYRRIKLTENECRAVFNISAEDWRESYGDTTYVSALDAATVGHLSDEAFIDYDYLLNLICEMLVKDKNTRQRINAALQYKFGLFNLV